MKFANYDAATGEILGYYDDGLHATIPEPNRQITDAEWRDCIEHPGLRRIDPATGQVITYTPPPPPLSDVQDAAYRAIDQAAGRARSRYITVAAGQEGTYLLKERQARDFAAAGYTGTVPAMVQSEMNATGATATDAANAIIAQADAWISVAATVEEIRIGAKTAIGAAADQAGVEAIRDQAIADLDAV